MTRFRLISTLVLSVAAAAPANAANGGDVITTAQIADAISNAGMKVSADQITLLTDVLAKTSTPTLRVQSMERWDDHRLRVRLDCANADECVPFFVAVRFSQPPAAASATPASAATALYNTPALPAGSTVPRSANAVAVKAGSMATLLLEGGHVHIQLVVVCLENGTPGQTIRVVSQDRRHNYMAEVIDGTTLKGRL